MAGSFSMAAGEYVSVKSQREMFEYQIGLEAEELRLDPSELGSPGLAAIFSFTAFAVGAFVPLPFFFAPADLAFRGSIALTGMFLAGIGASISLFTGKSAWLGGIRMLGIGGLAGASTYWIGRLLS